MSILIAAIVIFTLLWGEAAAVASGDRQAICVLMVAALTMLVPLVAALQIFASWKHHRRELPGKWLTQFRKMSWIHACLWSVVSVVVVSAAGWPGVVHSLTCKANVPLFDELLLIFPAMFSLVASWAIFIFASPAGTLSAKRTPKAIFSFWVRMRVIVIVAPILFAFLVTDLIQISKDLDQNSFRFVAIWILTGAGVMGVVALYPRLLLWIWHTKPLADNVLQQRILLHLQQAKLHPRKVHVWQTGQSVANAAAIGIIPGTEVIVLSDLLLEKFTCEEVDAIVLHEIGHIKARHCVKRIAMVLIPLVLLAVDQSLPYGVHASLNQNDLLRHLPAVGFVIYLYFISKSIFRAMEFEADQFAIETNLNSGVTISIDSALQKLASMFPQQMNRRSGLHPSISERLTFAIEVRARFLE